MEVLTISVKYFCEWRFNENEEKLFERCTVKIFTFEILTNFKTSVFMQKAF